MANARILIVDDEKGVVRSCTRVLERKGFIVTGKTDSVSVPDLLKQETFDLLLTDIKMPKIDGLELLKLAKEIDPHITVVLITGYGTMEDAIKAIRLGAQGFLLKPFDPQELVETVEDNLARRALMRDSLRLQMLLPLLQINQMLQVSGGEISLVQRVLDIAGREIGAARIAWLNRVNSSSLKEVAAVPHEHLPSHLPKNAVPTALNSGQPVWVLTDGSLVTGDTGQPNIIAAVLPLIIQGQVTDVLVAETGSGRVGPFGQISLELLSVLAGQLAIIIENVRLFQQTESLRAFNEDMIKNMSNGLIAIDKNGCITAFNPAASAMLGCKAQNVLTRPIDVALTHASPLVEVFKRTLSGNQARPRQEIAIQQENGQMLFMAISTALLGQEKNNEPEGVVGVLEDLTEIKAFEAERRRLDRLAMLGEMSAVVAHEIRNPIAGIGAGIDYLTRNLPKDSTEYEGGQMIQGEIKRVNRILEDILFVARPLQLNLAKHAVPPLIDNVLQRCQPHIMGANVKVNVAIDGDLPQIQADGQRLEQVFTNLVINATQAMEHGGNLDIEAYQTNGSITITLTDTGPGVPVEVQQQIFEPFFTTKAKGTGLGLSVARRIIEKHQGTIQIESKPDKGTRFIINLPGGKSL